MARFIGLSILIASIAGIAVGGVLSTPEIDASAGVAAIGLVGGGLLILRSRKKK